GMGKRQHQKLKFRDARDGKLGREVYGDDDTMEMMFGAAYTKKGKKSGKTHGIGKKQRQFVNFYGCNPDDFSLIRYVDPLTGYTIDADPMKPVHQVQNEIHDIRMKMIEDDELEYQHLYTARAGTLKAYLQRKNTNNVLEVDMTMHNPTLVCKSGTIAGHPDRENEARQTGPMRKGEMPQQNKYEEVSHE
nr:Nia-VPg [Ashitaba mosaic virus]